LLERVGQEHASRLDEVDELNGGDADEDEVVVVGGLVDAAGKVEDEIVGIVNEPEEEIVVGELDPAKLGEDTVDELDAAVVKTNEEIKLEALEEVIIDDEGAPIDKLDAVIIGKK
jgi:hypothetical protein